MKRYPWLEGAVRHGRLACASIATAALLGTAAAFLRTDSVVTLVVGLICTGVGYAALRVLVDVLDLIADTLLPK